MPKGVDASKSNEIHNAIRFLSCEQAISTEFNASQYFQGGPDVAKRIRRFSVGNTKLTVQRGPDGKLYCRLSAPPRLPVSLRRTRVGRTGKRVSVFLLLILAGCHSAPPSEIVRQVELADSGDVRQVPVESLMNFFDHRARLAVRVEALCAPKRRADDSEWKISDEGKVCQAVASRDRVQYLEALEAMKRMDTKDGDQGAAANIEKAEGK